MCDESSASKVASKKSSSLSRCVKAPLRALRRLRDMYVRSLGMCAGAGGGGGRRAPMTGVTAGMVAMMPRARSVNAFGNTKGAYGEGGEDDFKELVRANSKQLDSEAAAGVAQMIKRSQSVAPAIGRIDEDTPFDDDFDHAYAYHGDNLFLKSGIPRSKSCAVVPTARRINNVAAVATA